MMPRRRYTFFIDVDLEVALKRVKDRDGVNEGEQVRRALRAWFERRGELKKSERKRAVTRKRP